MVKTFSKFRSCTPICLISLFRFSRSPEYLLQWRITCSTDSSIEQLSHRPDGCFLIKSNVLFNLVSPTLVNMFLSFILLLTDLIVTTSCCNAYKCLPVFPLSQVCCRSLSMFLYIIPFASHLLSEIAMTSSCFNACLANVSTV